MKQPVLLRDGRDLPLVLDPDDPIPLYHQIVQAIRWRIGTGDLLPGHRLPPVRTAAKDWGVNFHTVRHAYRTLVEAGMLESRRGAGTIVLGGDDDTARALSAAPYDFEGWLDGVLAEARGFFDLTRDGLVSRIAERRPPDTRATLVECNDSQSRDLARQISARWGVPIAPWSLGRMDSPPPGLLIGTRFHAPEMRRRWPDRQTDMRFVSLRLDPRLVESIPRRMRDVAAVRIKLCELDGVTGREMAADLAERLPFPGPIDIATTPPREAFATLGPDELLLVAPRQWDMLPPDVRRDPRVINVRYVVEPTELEALGDLL